MFKKIKRSKKCVNIPVRVGSLSGNKQISVGTKSGQCRSYFYYAEDKSDHNRIDNGGVGMNSAGNG